MSDRNKFNEENEQIDGIQTDTANENDIQAENIQNEITETVQKVSQKKVKETAQEEVFSWKKEVFSWIKIFLVAIIIATVLDKFIIMNANVPSGSMENTIMTGDRMIGNRLAYINSDPKRGDVVIFKFPDDENQDFVKRVIGLPNEKVIIKDAKIYINDSEEPLKEDYLPETWINGNDGFTFEVPDGCYFVLGDNRNISNDARYWNNTFVKREKIVAKAAFVYWPYKDITKISTADYENN